MGAPMEYPTHPYTTIGIARGSTLKCRPQMQTKDLSHMFWCHPHPCQYPGAFISPPAPHAESGGSARSAQVEAEEPTAATTEDRRVVQASPSRHVAARPCRSPCRSFPRREKDTWVTNANLGMRTPDAWFFVISPESYKCYVRSSLSTPTSGSTSCALGYYRECSSSTTKMWPFWLEAHQPSSSLFTAGGEWMGGREDVAIR